MNYEQIGPYRCECGEERDTLKGMAAHAIGKHGGATASVTIRVMSPVEHFSISMRPERLAQSE